MNLITSSTSLDSEAAVVQFVNEMSLLALVQICSSRQYYKFQIEFNETH